MKRQITLLIFVFTINLSAQIKNEYYENGQIKATGEVKNDSRFGDWKLYHSNGVVSGTITYDSNGFPIPETFKTYNEKGEKVSCDCPEPTRAQLSEICSEIYFRADAKLNGTILNYSYQEKLWKISCADIQKDDLNIARLKIQLMWLKNRERFRCYNYPESIASDCNVLKFSLDNGFPGFIVEASRKYKLDLNFIDPKDNKTVLDFLSDQEKLIRNTPPVNTEKADEYQRIYKILRTNGAKHVSELNK
nr:hypothetical protein [uncultured Flavobacterium sp.]